MATYNGEKYLQSQLSSLSRQTTPPLELVVCDDLSSDSTLEILKIFAKSAPFPVRIEVNEIRLGYAGNFMKASSLCNGDFIAYCDQDDIWLENKLSVITKYIKDTGRRFFHHGYRLIDADGNIISHDINYDWLRNDVHWGCSLGLTQVFSREYLKFWHGWKYSIDHTAPSRQMSHDQWTYFLATLFDDTQNIPDVLLLYRQHGNNLYGYKSGSGNFDVIGNIRNSANQLAGRRSAFDQKRDYLRNMMLDRLAGCDARIRVANEFTNDTFLSKRKEMLKSLERYRYYSHYLKTRLDLFQAGPTLMKLNKLLAIHMKGLYCKFGLRGLKDSILDMIYGVFA